jgi:fructose 5-dehydrogenase small subunit
MTDTPRDDAHELYSLSRRQILIGGGLLFGAMAAASGTPGDPPIGALPDKDNSFMLVSSLLIQHHLNREVGKRLAIAMRIANPGLDDHIGQLLAIAKAHDAKCVEDFFPSVPDGPVKATALAIISAWYLGVVVDGPDAEVFAYELALLYQPTSDVMTIPSYAITGPNGWNAQSPPLTDMPDF